MSGDPIATLHSLNSKPETVPLKQLLHVLTCKWKPWWSNVSLKSMVWFCKLDHLIATSASYAHVNSALMPCASQYLVSMYLSNVICLLFTSRIQTLFAFEDSVKQRQYDDPPVPTIRSGTFTTFSGAYWCSCAI